MQAMTDHLCQAYPTLSMRLPKTPLAELPTRVEQHSISVGRRRFTIAVKHDEETSELYGGNKIRKLEYLLQRARERRALRVATFGAVASNHALATALHATRLGLACTCLLSHQTRTPLAAQALNMHLQCGSEIVCYGGERSERVTTMRKYVQGRRTWLIPMGGSNWLGVVGFVNAGLEIAAQVAAGVTPLPHKLYVANGTMATVAGLALGLAVAGLATEIQAVRVTHKYIATPAAMRRLMIKTVTLMNRLDQSVPLDLADRTKIRFREAFFGDGYAHPTQAGEQAIALADEQLGMKLDSTYTGKAMAALLHDIEQPGTKGEDLLFWNSYSGKSLPVSVERPADTARLPAEFLRYFD